MDGFTSPSDGLIDGCCGALLEWNGHFRAFPGGASLWAAGIAVAWLRVVLASGSSRMWYAGKPIDLHVGQVVGTVWRYVAASALAGAATFLTFRNFGNPGGFAERVRGSDSHRLRVSVFSVLYLAAVVILHGGTEPLSRILRLLGELRGKARAADAEPGHPTGESRRLRCNCGLPHQNDLLSMRYLHSRELRSGAGTPQL